LFTQYTKASFQEGFQRLDSISVVLGDLKENMMQERASLVMLPPVWTGCSFTIRMLRSAGCAVFRLVPGLVCNF